MVREQSVEILRVGAAFPALGDDRHPLAAVATTATPIAGFAGTEMTTEQTIAAVYDTLTDADAEERDRSRRDREGYSPAR